VDTLHIAALPKDIFRIGSLLSLVNHSNRGWLIFVAQHNVMLKFAVQVMVRNKFRFMSSRDEAIAFLRDVVKHAAQSATETTVEPPGV
jgi:hypothetical protein